MTGTVTIPVEEFERLRRIELLADPICITTRSRYAGDYESPEWVEYKGKDEEIKRLAETINRQTVIIKQAERDLSEEKRKNAQPQPCTERPFAQRIAYLFTNVLPEVEK